MISLIFSEEKNRQSDQQELMAPVERKFAKDKRGSGKIDWDG